LRLVTKK